MQSHILVLAGERGWKDGPIASLVQSGGARIRALGFVDDEALAVLYNGADALVFPSSYEGFGIPVLEARACGTRVVTTDLPELREAGGDDAIYVPPTSHALQFDETQSMWQSFLALARLIDPGLAATTGTFPIHSRPEADKFLEEWWKAHIGTSQRVIALHLGSAQGMEFRRWPLERFVRLAEELRVRCATLSIVLTGTAVEKNLIHDFRHKYSGHAVDASDLGTIENTVGVLRRCKLLVSNDTGISIWAPRSAHLQWDYLAPIPRVIGLPSDRAPHTCTTRQRPVAHASTTTRTARPSYV